MKKRLLFLIFILLAGLNIYAQSEIPVITSRKPIGKNHTTQHPIIAREIVFPEKIYHTYIDTLSNLITVQLRGTSRNGKWLDNTGKLIIYDLAGNKGIWSKYMNYSNGGISQHGNLIVQNIGNRSFSLNPQTGEEQWEVKNTIFYTDPLQKVGMGYKIRNAYLDNHIMEGFDLISGTMLWKREVNYDYGWNDVFHLSDSTIVIASSGLHMVNVKNGKGWDYNTTTGYSNYGGVVRDVVSNVWIDSANIYLASKEKLTRVDHQGKIIWSTALPDDLTSKSNIFKKDSILYFVNRGYAFMGYRRLDVGKAFIAAYDVQTGKQLFLTKTRDKKDEINGFSVRKDTLLLVFKDRISKYSLLDGSLIMEKEFDPYYSGELNYFTGGQVYTKTDSTYQNLAMSDTTKYYIYNSKEKILVLNNQLEITSQLDANDLYIYYLKEKDYKFLAKGDKTVVIDQSNKEIADVDISRITQRIGNKLYSIGEKSFIELDINDVIRE